jgi:ribosomal protein S6--L-glutamate ligase
MLTLAVATRAETFERIREPLAARDIQVVHAQTSGRTISLEAGFDDLDADVGLVYPSRVIEGGVADALLDIPWVNDRDAILTSRNKAAVLATLRQAEIPVPDTVLVSNPLDNAGALRRIFDDLGSPLVVKPTSTTRGVGVTKVHDVDSLRGVVDYVDLVHDYRATGDKSYLLQEYLPDATDYRVMVLDGEYVGAVERRLPDDDHWKHNVHNGATATAVDVPEHLRELAERTADVLDIPLLGVDLLITEDRAVVAETNARPTIDDASKYEPGFYDELAGLIETQADAK